MGATWPMSLPSAVRPMGSIRRCFEAEITEGEWLRSSAGVIEQLQQLRNMGVDVAIDDFGYRLQQLLLSAQDPGQYPQARPVDDFRTGIQRPASAGGQSIIGVARDLGYRTVAEGVGKVSAAWKYSSTSACDEAQGYFLSRPVEEALYFQQAALDRFPLKTG